MRVRGRRLLPLLIALLVMAGAFCYGAVRTSGEIWSHLETGSVKIGIETLGLEHGTFRNLPQEVIVDCEKPVSYVPRITNRGETCYLRVRLLAKAGDQELELADHLQDIQSGWIRKGEYLYYQEPVAYGRSVDVCRGFQLPEEWDFYQEKNLQNPAVIVDTNHSNSNKQYEQQVRIAKEVLHSRMVDPELHKLVKGFMIESYIEPGNQKIGGTHIYGKSITDPCLGWEESEKLLYTIAEMC